MLVDIPCIKVVLLKCDVFETFIADERNFNSYAEAKAFADLHSDLVPCIIELQSYIMHDYETQIKNQLNKINNIKRMIE